MNKTTDMLITSVILIYFGIKHFKQQGYFEMLLEKLKQLRQDLALLLFSAVSPVY